MYASASQPVCPHLLPVPIASAVLLPLSNLTSTGLSLLLRPASASRVHVVIWLYVCDYVCVCLLGSRTSVRLSLGSLKEPLLRCGALLRWGCRRLRRVVDVSGFFVILQAVVSVDFFVVSVFLYWQFLQLLPCPVGEAVDLLLLSGLRLRRQRCGRLSDAILRRCFYYLLLLYFFSLSLGYVFMFGDGVAVIYIHNLWLPYLRAMCGCVCECGVYRERRVCVSCCHYEWHRAVFDCILNCVNELSWLTHRHRKLLICKLIVCTAFYTWIFRKWPFALSHTLAHTHTLGSRMHLFVSSQSYSLSHTACLHYPLFPI